LGLFHRIFGLPDIEAKGVEFESDRLPSVIAGYPGWPVHGGYGEIYRRQPAVRTVVDFLARNIAQLNPKVYMRVGDIDRVEASDHPVAVLLRNPNPTTTRYAHWRDTVADIAIYDRAYWRKLKSRGLVDGVLRLPPSRLSVEFDRTKLKTVYRFDGEEISRDELVIFHGYHPDGSEEGVSPLETLRRVLSEEWASQTHREWFWRNAARQSGTIERPKDAPPWSSEARKNFREQWDEAFTGGHRSGRTAILEEGMTWNPNSFSPKDSEYIEGRKLTYEEVARVYAPSLVGLLGAEGQKANVESYHRQLYQDVLAPYCRMLQDEINGQLLSLDEFDFGDAYIEFNLREKLKGSFTEELEAMTTAVGVPHMTINEARARQNLTRIEERWADMPVQPMNVMYGGQPAVNVPIPESGTAASEYRSKLLNFYNIQEQVICSRLGDKARSDVAVFAMWDETRWNREHPGADGVQDNVFNRAKVAAAFSAGGVPAVHEFYETLKAGLDLEVPA
jgi:HK97 family phage portal protein